MTHPEHYTLPPELMTLLATEGLAALPEAVRVLINTAMEVERQHYLGVAPYERGPARQYQANGFKPKTVQTRLGEITFAVPQVRHGDFSPQALEKGLRSEWALTLTLAEMYVQGVSTRKVAAIVEQLCGTQVSSAQVSRATAQLDTILEAWRMRPLSGCPYLLLDARYEKVRVDGAVRDVAVLIAVGVTVDGHQRVLGVSGATSEAEVHWRAFLSSLVGRGLSGVQLLVSDAHEGLAAARWAVFGGVPWQRCPFHTIRTQSVIRRSRPLGSVVLRPQRDHMADFHRVLPYNNPVNHQLQDGLFFGHTRLRQAGLDLLTKCFHLC
jgi:transposase-like protein